jgi:hypothetical protein
MSANFETPSPNEISFSRQNCGKHKLYPQQSLLRLLDPTPIHHRRMRGLNWAQREIEILNIALVNCMQLT